jgi:endoglucanase
MKNKYFLILIIALFFNAYSKIICQKAELTLNSLGYYETRGLNILVFNNWYDGNFSDAKISGIEIIHHGVRTATNGDVRLSPTPGQWDPTPKFIDRKIDKEKKIVEEYLSYPSFNFNYTIKTEARDGGIIITVNLQDVLPKELEGQAGFNLEFLPSAYFEKAFLMDGNSGVFPLYPAGPMEKTNRGKTEPKPIASGNTFTLAPEDPERRIIIESKEGSLNLYDGRNQAQNGWYVVRTMIPSGKSGKVIEWFLKANSITGWTRKPMIAHSQVGYHPEQKKIAVIEFDKNDTPKTNAKLLKINPDGQLVEKYSGSLKYWGSYLRYNYSTFDFSQVKEKGLYLIEYDTIRTKPFSISENVYANAWQPTLDVFFPVQMDHVYVKEAYRVWHGASHLDDALQAPVNHEHFDLYAQGPTTDSPYKPGEHIPGLNIGGWFDAGDHDIRTETQYAVVISLVHAWEDFHLTRDETTVDENIRRVNIHVPDGKPDLLQQIEHGTLQLLAQQKSVGHAIPGIIVSDLSQYTHLGDAVSITDNLIYNPKLKPYQSDGFTSGTFDDRWAFTSKSTPLNYGSIAALAAASRALQGYNDALAEECLSTAKKVWDDEQSHKPDLFAYGNTTGGQLEEEKLKAAVELLLCTKDSKYKNAINGILPKIGNRFFLCASTLTMAIPYMDESYKKEIEKLVMNYKSDIEKLAAMNPFGVPISTGGWAGDGLIINLALTNYLLHKTFPKLIDKEFVLNGLNYIYGCHPGSDISFVSAVGTKSKRIAYGNNRADFTFIAGGIVPGVLILKPDFPENKEDWPFFWGENEYVINLGANYIYLVNAVNRLLNVEY